MFAKVLVPVDGSHGALRAAAVAAEIARRFDSQVTLLHVINVPDAALMAASMPGMVMPDETAAETLQETAQGILRGARQALALPDERVEQQVAHGHPAEIICRVAETSGHELIVIGSRGLSQVGAFFLGGVSDRVVHHAHCPVLIVR